jgi:pimeloyl-ACP methyl ester carboxylesterase
MLASDQDFRLVFLGQEDQTVQAQITATSKWGQVPNSSGALKQVRHPVLVANGDADVMVPTSSSIALFDALPNAKLSIFPNAGHGAIFQHADAFVDQTLRFLAG